MTKVKLKKERPTVAIVGPGRLGRALAIALSDSGYPIKALVARGAAKAEKAAELMPTRRGRIQVLGANHLAKLIPTDLILITTPDDAVENIAHLLAALETGKARGRIVLHTSGALLSTVLAPLAQVGFHTGSLHPLVSVSDSRSGAKALSEAFYCVEGDKAATKVARRIVSDLGGKSFSIETESKALYHAAALTAAGHLTALLDIAIEMLVSCGLSRQTAQQVLMPLVQSAVNNLKESPPEKALTGPFARGDLATVQRHLSALSAEEFAEALEVYRALGLHSLHLASRNRLDEQLLRQIRRALDLANAHQKAPLS